MLPSPHLHQVVGGNTFNATMLEDIPSLATCTSCTPTEDFSNYWTATLFFRYAYKVASYMVDQLANNYPFFSNSVVRATEPSTA